MTCGERIKKKLIGDFLLLESLKNLRMSELNLHYDGICGHVNECIETYFETNFSEIEDMDELDNAVELAFNTDVFTDHFSEDDVDGCDIVHMIRYICKYYEEEFGYTFRPHKKTNKDILNLFAFLYVEKYKHKFLEDKKPKPQ